MIDEKKFELTTEAKIRNPCVLGHRETAMSTHAIGLRLVFKSD